MKYVRVKTLRSSHSLGSRDSNLLPETSSYEVLFGDFRSLQARAEILKLGQTFSFHIPSSSLFTVASAKESSTSLFLTLRLLA